MTPGTVTSFSSYSANNVKENVPIMAGRRRHGERLPINSMPISR